MATQIIERMYIAPLYSPGADAVGFTTFAAHGKAAARVTKGETTKGTK